MNLALAANIQIPLAQALGWMRSVNPNYDFVEALVRTFYEVGPSQWEAPDWLLAQVAVETGNGLSEWALKHNNFGGIGVDGSSIRYPQTKKPDVPNDHTNDWVWFPGDNLWRAGLTKPNVVEGVLMMIAHRKAFTDPNYNSWAASNDTRYGLARSNRTGNGWPVAKTIDYFGKGRWAADPDYWPKIVEKFKAMQSWKGK
jgi:hypothetical protein